jgi:hypothetical protein
VLTGRRGGVGARSAQYTDRNNIAAWQSVLVRRLRVQGCFAAAGALTDQGAQFKQARAEPVRARLDAVDHAFADHHVEYAVRGRGMQPGFFSEPFKIHRRGMGRKPLEQVHHAVYDLNR